MADISGATNGLVILASVSLAITQHFQNSLKIRFGEAQTSLRDAFLKNSDWFNEKMRKRYDDLRAKHFDGVTHQITSLFIILFILGAIKFFDLCDYLWNGEQHTWQIGTICVLTATTFFYTILLGWIAVSLRSLAQKARDMERESGELVRTAEAIGDSHGHPPTSPHGSDSPYLGGPYRARP